MGGLGLEGVRSKSRVWGRIDRVALVPAGKRVTGLVSRTDLGSIFWDFHGSF